MMKSMIVIEYDILPEIEITIYMTILRKMDRTIEKEEVYS